MLPIKLLATSTAKPNNNCEVSKSERPVIKTIAAAPEEKAFAFVAKKKV